MPHHTTMTSRERVLAAIDHQEPDRVPVDLGATPSSGISAIAYYNLKRHLGITGGHTRVYDVVQQLAQPEDDILERFGVDIIDIGRAFNTSDDDWYDITLPTGQPVQFPAWFRPVEQPDGSWDVFDPDGDRIATMPLKASFFDQTCFPYVDGYPDDYRRPAAYDGQDPLGRAGAQPVGPRRRGRFLGATAGRKRSTCVKTPTRR